MKFLWVEGARSVHTVFLQQSMYKCTDMLKNGQTSVEIKNDQGAHPHQQLKGTLNKSTQWFLITDGWPSIKWQTSCKLVTVLPMSVHERLHLHKVCVRLVQKQLIEQHRHNHLAFCNNLLSCYHEEGDAFLCCIVTGDELWICHYNAQRKHWSMEWKHLTSSVKKQLRYEPTAGKVILTLVWDSQDRSLSIIRNRMWW